MNKYASSRATCLLALVGLVVMACNKPQSTDPNSSASPSAATAGGAQITEAQAREIALEAIPGGEVDEAELETEDGILIWSLDVTRDGTEYEVHVDPATGEVLSAGEEVENGDHADADEQDGADDHGDADGGDDEDDEDAGDVSGEHTG